MKPKEPDSISKAGLKRKATISKVTVMVYWVPVGFWWELNMATSPVVERD
jgi:hypothetical protein